MQDNDIIIGVLVATIVILILIVIIVLIIVFSRRLAINQELRESQFRNKLNELSLSSLRSQMNPHFIFNCLNSIKYFTEINEKEKASEYLTKFSKLIRNILEYSREETTILSSEIETLELYLQLESIRFNRMLTYSILVSENVDTDYVELPPLIIQPFVENAIWHGLMNKDDGGEIQIVISQQDEENILKISIEDNGVGRERALALQRNRKDGHKSFGTQISQERIDLLNSKSKYKASVQIIDLKDNQGLPIGTKVLIQIPLS